MKSLIPDNLESFFVFAICFTFSPLAGEIIPGINNILNQG
jgi:hypothetical protein